ncbi:hypothetical protein [Synechococcus sp. 1G10]|uniref:hypothetical protein n=1 Tax=Synechococcus sp. 1G10 TaxID=2025605 RepID=UPI0013038E26|nr:hypothetical protein [Synechococcus sp. 1G10]
MDLHDLASDDHAITYELARVDVSPAQLLEAAGPDVMASGSLGAALAELDTVLLGD